MRVTHFREMTSCCCVAGGVLLKIQAGNLWHYFSRVGSRPVPPKVGGRRVRIQARSHPGAFASSRVRIVTRSDLRTFTRPRLHAFTPIPPSHLHAFRFEAIRGLRYDARVQTAQKNSRHRDDAGCGLWGSDPGLWCAWVGICGQVFTLAVLLNHQSRSTNPEKQLACQNGITGGRQSEVVRSLQGIHGGFEALARAGTPPDAKRPSSFLICSVDGFARV